jgi:hypothetical protein
MGRYWTMNERKPSERDQQMDMEAKKGKKLPKLGPDIRTKIGQQLRTMYSDVLNEGVPDRFSELMRRLDEDGPGEKK